MRPTLLHHARRFGIWCLRVLTAFVMHSFWLPHPLKVVWLEWQDECLPPDDPRKAQAVLELAEARGRCRA